MSAKSSQNSKPKTKSTVTIRQEDVMNYLRDSHLSVELIDKLLSTLMERQELINRQLDESEKKYNLRVEESNRLFNENEKIFFRKMDEKKQQIENITEAEIEEEEKIKETVQGSEKTKVIQKTKLHASGDLNEYLVCLEIINRFNELGYYFDDITLGGRRILDNMGKTKAEFKIILENLQCLIAVELISNPKKKDLEQYISNLKILREHRNKYEDKRKIYGAIAGSQFGSEDKQTILKNGIYLFEQSGKTVKLNMPDNFFPLEL
jgi:hypothetical protein